MDPANEVNQLLQSGYQFQQAGRLAEADACYRRILDRHPNHVGALMLSGMVRHQAEDYPAAISMLTRAAAADPTAANLQLNLGFALKAAGKIPEAMAAYREAIRLQPAYTKAHFSLAYTLEQQELFPEAEHYYRRAIDSDPSAIESRVNLFLLLATANRYDDSLAAAEDAWRARPDVMRILTNYANNLSMLGRLDEAKIILSQAERLLPTAKPSEVVNYHTSMSKHFYYQHDYPRSIEHLDAASKIDPDYAPAHEERAEHLMVLRRWSEGWPEFEWRWKDPKYGEKRRPWKLPFWDGSPPAGRTMVLTCEQGIGDTIQYLRLVPLLAKAGARIILEVQPPLLEVARGVAGVSQVVAAHGPEPAADMQFPLMSLPRMFNTTVENVPTQVPYIAAPATLVDRWARRIGDDGRLRIGLAWSGNPSQSRDRWRSMHQREFVPLLKIPAIHWFVIQKGPGLAQVRDLPPEIMPTILDPELNSFADTAAAMMQMDLILTTDTSVSHMAGALGRPTWTMLNYFPDWRYEVGRSDCIWYPTMRLWRQPKLGDWNSVIGEVADALEDVVKNRR